MKRANGEGSIRRRADGRWEARIRIGNGERKYVMGKTQAEVREKLAKIVYDLDRGITPQRDERLTLGDWLDQWLATIKTKREYSYWKRCEAVIRLYVAPMLGKVPLTKVTPQQVQHVYTHVASLGKKPNTVKKIHIALSSALNEAVKLDLVPRNVAAIVGAPTDDDRQEMKTYTPEQVRRLIESAQDEPHGALFIAFPLTGCRLGEWLGASWAATDLDQAELHVVSAMKDVAGKQWMGTPKTPSSRRIVPLPAVVVKALRQHHVNQTAERVKHDAGWNPHNLVFCTKNGTPHSQTNMRKYYMRFLEKNDLPYIRMHDLRHTFGSAHLSAGTPVHEVRALMGHTSASTTLDFYAHVMPGARDQNRATIERVYGNQENIIKEVK